MIAREPFRIVDHPGKNCPAPKRLPIVRLNREQPQRVFELLDNPPEPNAALLSAKAAHRKLLRA